jgi:hypothetical protein
MSKTSPAKKTSEQIRAETDKLINDHHAGIQGWLLVHHPARLSASVSESQSIYGPQANPSLVSNKPYR